MDSAKLENELLRSEIERLTKELFAAKSTRLLQRKPLTDEEIALNFDTFVGGGLNGFARAIERAHGIGGKDE